MRGQPRLKRVTTLYHHPPLFRSAITRLVGAILLEQNDEWAVQRTRYMTLETIAPLRDDLALTAHGGRVKRGGPTRLGEPDRRTPTPLPRSEEHTSELQSQMRISYAVFCLKKIHV